MGATFNDPAWRREERRLIRRARKGDREAMGRLYAVFAAPLYARVLVPLLGDRHAAEDALAETFRAALERLPTWKEQGVSVWYWLAKIARSKAIDMHRARARTGRALASCERLLAPLREDHAAGDDGPEAVDRERLQRAVRLALEQLNPRYRRALEARFLEGRSREECATLLEVKVATFDVVLFRALRAFRRVWCEQHGVSRGAESEASAGRVAEPEGGAGREQRPRREASREGYEGHER